MKSSIGESAISPQLISRVAPDVISPQGKQELFTKQAVATTQKKVLDTIFIHIANKIGASFTSRIKNPDTVAQKIALKRIQGKNYGVNDVGDYFGGRFITDNKNIPKIERQMKEIGFNITESQPIKKGTYSAFHINFKTPQGTNGEIQIMPEKRELEAVATHDIRAQHGENPPDDIKKIRNSISQISKKIPDNKAHMIAQAIEQLRKK